MKAKELAELLLQNPDLDVVLSGHPDAGYMYDDVLDVEKITVSVIPRDYSWSHCPYASDVNDKEGEFPKKEVIAIGG